MNDLNYIDLFAGAGGLSEGFIKSGFNPIAHVENDVAACYTLKTRAAYVHLKKCRKLNIYNDYLAGKISRDALYSHVPEEVLESVINAPIGRANQFIFDRIDHCLGGRKLDVIIGGPPCQAYSVVGRAPLKHKKNDERTRFYVQYGRFLKRYQPKIFIFENVPGILSAAGGLYFKNLQKYYKALGYVVEARILNACDYGVIQNRQRVITIGWKRKLKLSYPNINKVLQKFTRDDIFLDLPAIRPGESSRIHRYARRTNNYLEKTSIRNGVNFVSQHWARPHNRNDLKIYKLAINGLNKGKRLKNSDIPVKDRTQKNISSFIDRFKVVGSRPHTLIAHIAKDGHHFIHPDPRQLRSISVREAARIQSFPDNFYFEGTKPGYERTSAFRQIGNAVPPLMAQRIAKSIKEMLTHGS